MFYQGVKYLFINASFQRVTTFGYKKRDDGKAMNYHLIRNKCFYFFDNSFRSLLNETGVIPKKEEMMVCGIIFSRSG